jgi:hypothetical protein
MDYMGMEQNITLQQEVARLKGEVANLEQGRQALILNKDEAVAEARTLRLKLESFQAQVRDVAIRVAKENDWCVDGLNDVLGELSLPAYQPKWRVELTVTVVAADDYDARDLVSELLSGAAVEDYDISSYAEEVED